MELVEDAALGEMLGRDFSASSPKTSSTDGTRVWVVRSEEKCVSLNWQGSNPRAAGKLAARLEPFQHALPVALVPLKLLRSTLPATPGTVPVVVNCQNAHERLRYLLPARRRPSAARNDSR